MVNFALSGPKLTQADIEHVERTLKWRLPAAYHRFLLDANGGVPSPNIVDFEHRSDQSTNVQQFLAVHAANEMDDLLEQWELLQESLQHHFGDICYLPFAIDPFGNHFCMAMQTPNEGAVYYWEFWKNVAPGYDHNQAALFFIAPDFDSFLTRLRDISDAEKALLAD